MSYVIKCEINGIQEFIFNIKSKGAAKALKARSFLIDALGILIEENIKDIFPDNMPIFTGGGNVLIEIKSGFNKDEFTRLKNEITDQLIPYQIQFSAISKEYENGMRYRDFIVNLDNELNKEKLRLGNHDISFFSAKDDPYKDITVYQEFSKEYSESNSYIIPPVSDNTNPKSKIIGRDFIRLRNKTLKLSTDKSEQNLIPLPLWKNGLPEKHIDYIKKQKNEHKDDPAYYFYGEGILNFEDLAYFAATRTGTDNIAVLKMDVDNLGQLFHSMTERNARQKLSKAFKDFFRNGVIKLLEGEYRITIIKKMEGEDGRMKEVKQIETIKFSENIYTVFAGGDDCFFIGAWDAIIEFAIRLHTEFDKFQEKLRSEEELSIIQQPITISAAIVIVDSHFPVVRFAELAEEELAAAKNTVSKNGEKEKNRIRFMSHSFTWTEFTENLRDVKNTMHTMVSEDNIPKAFLQRIINSFENSDTTSWKRCTPPKPFDPAILWRFHYSFRDIKHKEPFKSNYNDKFFSTPEAYYKKYVWEPFVSGGEMSQIMPVAARWVELLNRNKN